MIGHGHWASAPSWLTENPLDFHPLTENAIKSLFAEGGPLYFMASYGIWGYAILVTLIAIAVTIWVGRMAEKAKKEEMTS